jgi:cytosine/adenosine deaminase-related metal-dependent hydrolase
MVFPVTAPPLADGVVVVQSGRVTQIGRKVPPGVEVTDLGNVVLLPGLVNAHTHLEFSDRKKPLGKPGIAMSEWVQLVINQRTTAKKKVAAIAAGQRESLLAGVTTVGEISTTMAGDYLGYPRAPRTLRFHEVIGFSQARANSAHNSVVKRLGQPSAFPSLETVPGVSLEGISPHAPYTVSPPLVRQIVATAGERNMPVAFHLAESVEELDFLMSGSGGFQAILEERGMWDPWAVPRGSAPLDYLRMLIRSPRALIVHGNYLDRKELAFVGRHRDSLSLVYCPRTHAYFGHTPYPLEEALSLNVRVCLGTDSRASNPDLSLLTEMRLVAARHPRVSAEQILEMATFSAATAMGLDRVCGAIQPQRPADMIAVPIPAGAGENAGDVLAAVLADTSPASTVWIAGERVPNDPD